MPSRERPAPFFALVARELRAVFALPSFWLLLLAAGPLAGVAFREALADFVEASSAVAHDASLAARLDPFSSVVAPSFAALSATTALFFPVVAARRFGDDQESGAHALLWQLGYRPLTTSIARAFALGVALLVSALPALTIVGAFAAGGGHVHAASLAPVLAGHALAALVVVGIAAVSAAATRSASSAALFSLAASAGLWAFELWGARAGLVASAVAAAVPSAQVHVFERGVVDAGVGLTLASLGAGLVAAGAVLLAPAVPAEKKLVRAFVVVAAAGLLALVGTRVHASWDLTEGRRSSLPRVAAEVFAKVGDPIRVTARLRFDDPHFAALERNVLGPMARVADVEVRRVDVAGRRYGLVTYQVGTRAAESRSIERDEVVPLVLDLAGLKAPLLVDAPPPGHPFSGTAPLAAPLAFVAWPALALFGLARSRRRTAA